MMSNMSTNGYAGLMMSNSFSMTIWQRHLDNTCCLPQGKNFNNNKVNNISLKDYKRLTREIRHSRLCTYNS